SGYIYFVGLSAGAFLLSSLVYVGGVASLQRVARPALLTAAITLGMALLCIWFDLGHMWRFWEIFTRPSFSSLMAWMVWLYSAYFLLILLELWFEMRLDLSLLAREGGRFAGLYRLLSLGYSAPADPEGQALERARAKSTLRILGAIGVPLAIAFHGGVGALFASLSARPYWHTALYPILFLTGALVSGGALLLAVVSFTELGRGEEGTRTLQTLSRAVVGLLVFDLILEWAEISIPAWYRIGSEYELLKVVLFGQYWYVFWIGHILLGAVIPIVLLLRKPPSASRYGVAGALIAATFLAVRLNLVIPGQVTPQLHGLESAYVDHRLLFSYVPSLFEWSIIAFVVAVGATVFLLARRILPMDGEHGPHPVR
ncbi:MAG: hypothetical protein D6701_14705, partial [Gemmatimonadetes bacterium]